MKEEPPPQTVTKSLNGVTVTVSWSSSRWSDEALKLVLAMITPWVVAFLGALPERELDLSGRFEVQEFMRDEEKVLEYPSAEKE